MPSAAFYCLFRACCFRCSFLRVFCGLAAGADDVSGEIAYLSLSSLSHERMVSMAAGMAAIKRQHTGSVINIIWHGVERNMV